MSAKFIIILVFIVVIFSSLILDLGLFAKDKDQKLTMKQSIQRTLIWFALGLLSVLAVYFFHYRIYDITNIQGLQKYSTDFGTHFEINSNFQESLHNFRMATTTAYFSGYILEYALSVDNLFVMLLIFGTFKVSAQNEKRVLLWGVLAQ